jgi:hypothetical protein
VNWNRRNFLAAGAATLAWGATRPTWAAPTNTPMGPWEKFDKPTTDSGLVNTPRLVNLKGRITLFWAGTNSEARSPEVMYCSANDGDATWSKTRAPFFGNDMGRVRKLAVATSRDSMGLVFQRETTQGNGAVEILLSLSADSGYSFANPFVMDSYVLGQEGGSYLSCGARQGRQRPEFAALWVAEGGVVRVANIDPRSGFRPRALAVGEVDSIRSRAEIVGAGPDGFQAFWPEGGGLKVARVHPLTGTIDPAQTLASGDYLRNFAVCSHYRGPAYLTAANEAGELKLYQAKDDKVALKGTSKFPITGRKLETRSCLEGDEHIHMLSLESGSQPRLLYSTNRGGSWSAAEVACNLAAEVPVTGFDIAVSDQYVWLVVGQEQLMQVWRRKIS